MLELSRAMLGSRVPDPTYLLYLPIAYTCSQLQSTRIGKELSPEVSRLEVEPLVNSHVRVRHASLTTILNTY